MDGASQSHNLCNINEITTSNALHSPHNDIENLIIKNENNSYFTNIILWCIIKL